MGISFEGDSLLFGGKRIAPDIRTFGQMRPVLCKPDSKTSLSPDSPTYFMYRGAEEFGSVRYDITRIPPLDLCGERNKTFGHSHPKSRSGTAYPEIYEVLQGSAHFLLQKVSQLGVADAALLSAIKGDKLLIPPGYGHVTINAGKGELLLANLVCSQFSSDYSLFAHQRGACFYEMKDGKLVRNKNYGADFELRKGTAAKFSSSFGCFAPFAKQSLLSAAADHKNIEFLEKPETFY